MKHEEIIKKISPVVLRVAMALVFLWFGLNQVFDTDSWIFFLPEFLRNYVQEPAMLVFMNGIVEIFLGTFLLVGVYVRFSAFVLAINLSAIVIAVGYNSVGVRDFGLAVATFAIALNGSDFFSFDEYFKRKNKDL